MSTRSSGAPRASALPLPRGITTSRSSCASARTRATCSLVLGATTQRGATPSTTPTRAASGPSLTNAEPVTSASADPIVRVDTLTVI